MVSKLVRIQCLEKMYNQIEYKNEKNHLFN